MMEGAFIIRTRSRNLLIFADFSTPDIPSPLELKMKSASSIIDRNYIGVPLNTQVAYPMNANVQPVILVSQD